MARRYFNWKLALVLFVGIIVFAGAAYALRQWRRSMRAEEALPLGNKAYDEQKWDEAAKQFGRYLSVDSGNVDILLKYADAQMKKRPLQRTNFDQAVAAYLAHGLRAD